MATASAPPRTTPLDVLSAFRDLRADIDAGVVTPLPSELFACAEAIDVIASTLSSIPPSIEDLSRYFRARAAAAIATLRAS